MDPNLTILTGANGVGKTTLLNIFSEHFGWSRPLLATPWRNADGSINYVSGALRALKAWLSKEPETQTTIGKISYSSGHIGQLSVPVTGNVQYNIQISNKQVVRGLSIPSHRIVSPYQQINAIPTNGITAQQAYQRYNSELLTRFQGNHSGSSPIFRMKEALIAMATFGAGNRFVKGQPKLLDAYVGFIEILRKVLPSSLGFETIEIRTPDVVLVTKSGEFLLDAMSGGLNALVDLAWQIYTFSYDGESFVVVIDEPENHLHPAMQRALLPSFLNAFPNVQFIVATHSPFIVTSMRDSNVYVLAYKEGPTDGELRAVAPARSVRSTKLDQVNKAGSANEILRNVLGLDSTMPLWASQELESIVDRYRNIEFTPDKLEQLNAELAKIGLAEGLPSVMDAVFRGHDKR